MRYGIDIGHNSPPDIGAMGGYEDQLNLELAEKVIVKLRLLGNEVLIVNPKGKVRSVHESLKIRCDNANAAKVERYVSFHFNAFNKKAHGTEVYYTSLSGKRIAQPVLEEISKLTANGKNLFNRGIKKTSLFQVLNGTNAPAILIETCFCDNSSDIEIYKAIGCDRVATAIVKGLTGKNPPLEDQPCLYIE